MRLIILEGIATSGKTSVKNRLAEILREKGIGFVVVGEEESLMPVLDNTDRRTSIDLLRKVIKGAMGRKKDFVIFDRLFFTHIFRTNGTIEDFREIEDLIKGQSLLAFLEMEDSSIPERISNARRHRGKGWDDYVSKKGSEEEIHRYYSNQQKTLLSLLEKTSVRHKKYDTTAMDFDSVADDILKMSERG